MGLFVFSNNLPYNNMRTNNQRTINILNKAIENGFEFDERNSLEEIRIEAEEFLIENTEAIEEECEVKSLGNHGQRVDWNDRKGFEFCTQGEIVDFSKTWFSPPETKVFHNKVVNSEGIVVNLFFYVGKTEFNTLGEFFEEDN